MNNLSSPITPVLVIHGGAGAISKHDITPALRLEYEQALTSILEKASATLFQGGSALDAVTHAVQLLEDCSLFNAGHGAVFTRDKTHELDAAVMDGTTEQAGAVAMVSHLKNPILAARLVMEKSEHVMLVGTGAEHFAIEHGAERVEPNYFSTAFRREQLERMQADAQTSTRSALDHDVSQPTTVRPLDEDKKMGTVGAVAIDQQGRLAAATSTGGMTNKLPGRVGDSPIIGAGCYADSICAVSCTGAGEAFIRLVVGHDIAAQMRYGNKTLEQATNHLVHQRLPRIQGDGGLIAVDHQGNVAMPFNTEGMYRGVIYANQAPWVAIHNEDAIS